MKSGWWVVFLVLGSWLFVLPGAAQTADGQARLVIVDSRDPHLWDYRVRFYDETKKEIATMKRCQIVRVGMTPGVHKFRSNKGKKPAIEINAVAGQTYYARAGLREPFSLLMWFDFQLVTREEAEKWVSKCNLPASALDEVSSKAEQQP